MLWAELRGKQVATISEWLASLGMSEYAERFADNRIDDVSVLRELTDQDLKDIGVPLGHRRKMLRAIGETGRYRVHPSKICTCVRAEARETMPSAASSR